MISYWSSKICRNSKMVVRTNLVYCNGRETDFFFRKLLLFRCSRWSTIPERWSIYAQIHAALSTRCPDDRPSNSKVSTTCILLFKSYDKSTYLFILFHNSGFLRVNTANFPRMRLYAVRMVGVRTLFSIQMQKTIHFHHTFCHHSVNILCRWVWAHWDRPAILLTLGY